MVVNFDGMMAVLLRFEPLDAALECKDGGNALFSQTINLPLKLKQGQDITTPDGRSLKNIEWAISFHLEDQGQFPRSFGGIGMFNYYPGRNDLDIDEFPESCLAWACIDLKNYELLREMVIQGTLPENICMHVRGLQYGCDLGGDEKVWDVAATPNALLERVQIGFPFRFEAGRQDQPNPPPPAPNADLASIERLVSARIQQSHSRIQGKLTAMIILLALIAAILALK